MGLPNVSLDMNWTEEQRKDPVLATVCRLVRGGQKPTKEQRAQCEPEVLKFLNEWPRLISNQDVLYRKRVNTDGEKNWQLLCPQQLCNVVCKLLLDDMGHLGQDRTITLCEERFYRPGMSTDVVEWIYECFRCTCAKAPSLPHCAPLENIITSQPMEMLPLTFYPRRWTWWFCQCVGHNGPFLQVCCSHTYYQPDCQDDSSCFLWCFHCSLWIPHKNS